MRFSLYQTHFRCLLIYFQTLSPELAATSLAIADPLQTPGLAGSDRSTDPRSCTRKSTKTQWRENFKPLGSVKKLGVPDPLFGEGRHSRSLDKEFEIYDPKHVMQSHRAGCPNSRQGSDICVHIGAMKRQREIGKQDIWGGGIHRVRVAGGPAS
jgi:hypothetical protein